MENKTVPYLAYELEQAKHERTVRRLVAVLIVTIVLMFLSNVAWIYAWSRSNSSENSVVVDGEANIVGRDGNITNSP